MVTLGLEEELWLVDKADLMPIRQDNPDFWQETALAELPVKREFFNAQIEIISPVCQNLAELERHIYSQRANLARLAEKYDYQLLASGTHPTARCTALTVTDNPHYYALLDRMGQLMREFAICGLHWHIGGFSTDSDRFRFLQAIRNYLPLLLAITAGSPYWQGQDTSFASYRQVVFSQLPRTGIPPTMQSFEEYQAYTENMVTGGFIPSPKFIRWDARIHALYPTVEIRICDMLTSPKQLLALAALIFQLAEQIQSETRVTPIPDYYLTENRWLALRHGLEAEFLTQSGKVTSPTNQLAELNLPETICQNLLDSPATKLRHIYNQTSFEGVLTALTKIHS
jgi:glutamate---cysteine ligase / carboxylate-amine ligase